MAAMRNASRDIPKPSSLDDRMCAGRQAIRDAALIFRAKAPREVTRCTVASAVKNLRSVLPYDDLVIHLQNRPGFRPGPDVVNLGPPRTGSSWFFWHCFKSANAAKIPGKEINFLNYAHRAGGLLTARHGAAWWAMYNAEFSRQFETWIEYGFHHLVAWAIVALVGERDWSWYETITGGASEEVGIDYTPNNISSQTMVLASLKERSQSTKLFYTLRDPLQRAASYWRHIGLRDDDIVDEVTVLPVLAGKRLTAIHQTVGDVRQFMFCDLERDPEAFLRRLGSELGLRFSALENVGVSINARDGSFAPRFTHRARDLFLDDFAQFREIVAASVYDQWSRDLEGKLILQTRWV